MRLRHALSTIGALLFSLMISPLFAQKNFQQGFVVLTSGDTLHGFIDYRNWEKNPKKIKFRTSIDATNLASYSVNDLKYFKVANEDAYQMAALLKDMSATELSNLNNYQEKIFVTDTVFLRILTEGRKLTLFELIDERPHYFIQPVNGEMIELTYRLIRGKPKAGYLILLTIISGNS